VRGRAADVGPEGDFGGHSLRSGLATSAARAGKAEACIMWHGRWRSVQVARRYIRAGHHWDDNAAVKSLKKQQLRWTERGSRHLLQLLTRVLNDEWRATMARWNRGLIATA